MHLVPFVIVIMMTTMMMMVVLCVDNLAPCDKFQWRLLIARNGQTSG